uniref:DUF2007 domain-containing protein n=1 Tax=candidate division WOR-3 bacterium TaxID=2052148 RepID=A0A7C4TGP2_UNCW3
MLKKVFVAQDEFTAITIREMLKSRNIESIIKRYETTWLDGLPKIMEGGWGEILVEEKDFPLAEEYINEFLESSPHIDSC